MGEREPVRSYLQEVLDKQAAKQRRKDEVYKQNGRLLDEGLLLLGKSIRLLIEHGDRTLKDKPTPPIPIELDGQEPILLSLSESFAQDYDSITEGVGISFVQDGRKTVLFKILPWGRVENTQGQQVSSEELKIAEKILDLLQNSSSK